MMKQQKILNSIAAALAAALVLVVLIGILCWPEKAVMTVSDGIESIDLNSISLENSGVQVSFSDVILSEPGESRKLIVSTQTGTVTTQLTDRLIQKLDFDFLKKTQSVSYTGSGYFVVDLDNLREENLLDDKEKKILTIRIDHAYLQAIEIDPNNIIIDEVKEGLLARGDIELSLSDYNTIEKELRSRLEASFDTVSNGQKADDLAIEMVKDVYEPVVKAIDPGYTVLVEFK